MVWGIAILIMAVADDFGPALLLFATVLTLFIIPVLYQWLAPYASPADAVKQQLEKEMSE